LLFGLIITIVISHNFLSWLHFAYIAKIIYISILGVFLFSGKEHFKGFSGFWVSFLLFFAVSSVSLFFANDFFDSLTRQMSYVLLILITPNYVEVQMKRYGHKFFKDLLYFNALILLIGVALRFLIPSFTNEYGRFAGLFMNPNGLGVFILIFFMQFIAITAQHPKLLSLFDKRIVLFAIFASLILSSSRGAMVAIAIFYSVYFMSKQSIQAGFILFIIEIAGYNIFLEYAETLIQAFGLESYFRLSTLKTGSGRLVAYAFAWEQIQNNFFIGQGFGYADWLFHTHEIEIQLNALNHQGGTHNSYLTIWMDTGFLGLMFFLFGWGSKFLTILRVNFIAFPMMMAVLFSSFLEAWLSSSLNAFTIQLLILLIILSNPLFYTNEK